MEFLLEALATVVIKSSQKAAVEVSTGIKQPTYERQCFGRDEIARLDCEKRVKNQKLKNQREVSYEKPNN